MKVSFPGANPGRQIPRVAGLSVLVWMPTPIKPILTILWHSLDEGHEKTCKTILEFYDLMIVSETKFCSSTQRYSLWLRECSLVHQCPSKPTDKRLEIETFEATISQKQKCT